MSLRLAEVAPGLPGVEIDGRLWRLATSADPAVRAPELPRV